MLGKGKEFGVGGWKESSGGLEKSFRLEDYLIFNLLIGK